MPGAAWIKTCWAVTIDSLSEWQEGGREAVENEESSVRQYYDVAVEPGGAFWLAASDGLVRYAPLTWRSPAPVRKLSALVHGLAGDEAGRLWFVSGAGAPRPPERPPSGVSAAGLDLKQRPGYPRPVSLEGWNAVPRGGGAVPPVSS